MLEPVPSSRPIHTVSPTRMWLSVFSSEGKNPLRGAANASGDSLPTAS